MKEIDDDNQTTNISSHSLGRMTLFSPCNEDKLNNQQCSNQIVSHMQGNHKSSEANRLSSERSSAYERRMLVFQPPTTSEAP